MIDVTLPTFVARVEVPAPSIAGPLLRLQAFKMGEGMLWEVSCLPSLDHLYCHKHAWRARACDGRPRAFRRWTTCAVTSIHRG